MNCARRDTYNGSEEEQLLAWHNAVKRKEHESNMIHLKTASDRK